MTTVNVWNKEGQMNQTAYQDYLDDFSDFAEEDTISAYEAAFLEAYGEEQKN